MKSKKLLVILLTLVMLASLFAGCSPAENEGPIEIKIGHTDSSSRSTHTWSVWLGDFLEKNAPGRFVVEVYPNGEIGDTLDLVAAVKLGSLTMTSELASVVAEVAGPEASAVDLPYLYPTYEAWETGTFEMGGLELFNDAIEDAGYYALGMYYNGIRQVISRDKIYPNPEDFNGAKVRIAQNDLNLAMWDAMGGIPTPMAWGEVITSLSQGIVDSLDHSLGVFNDFSLHEIAPYITLTNHASSPCPIICSKEWFDDLTRKDQAIIQEGITLMCEGQRDEERGKEEEYIQRFKDEGATVYELTPEEMEVYKEVVNPVYDDFREQVGDEVIDAWLNTVPE